MTPPLLGLQADLDQHDSHGEQHADGHDHRNERRRHGVAAKRDQRQRKADKAGVRIAGVQRVDRRVSQMAGAAAAGSPA